MGIKGWNMFGAMILQNILNAFYSRAWPWTASQDYSLHQHCCHFLPSCQRSTCVIQLCQNSWQTVSLDKICEGLMCSDSCPCYWGNHAGLVSPQVEFVKEESGRWNCKALVSCFSLLRSHWHWHFQFKNSAFVCKSSSSLRVCLDKNTSWRNSLWKCFQISPGLWFSVASKEGPARLLPTLSRLLYCFLICF